MSFNILSRKEMTMMLLPAGICFAYTTIVLRQFHTVGTEQKVENSMEKEIFRETIIVKLHCVDYLKNYGNTSVTNAYVVTRVICRPNFPLQYKKR